MTRMRPLLPDLEVDTLNVRRGANAPPSYFAYFSFRTPLNGALSTSPLFSENYSVIFEDRDKAEPYNDQRG